MTPLAAEGLSFEVRGAKLLSDVQLIAESGQLIAIIGPNGAGKSTLLRLLAGDLRPTSGAIRIFDQSLLSLTPDELARMRAVLPQHVDRDIPFTAHAVVGLGRHPHRNAPESGAQRDQELIDAAMAATSTSHLADRIVATLSGGEQARVSLARVLAQDTPLILLDEPTASLDVAHEVRTMELLVNAAASGRTVIMALHDLNAAAAHADRLVLMDAGGVRADGAPEAVLDADLLTQVYGQSMRVMPHPFRDCLLVLAG